MEYIFRMQGGVTTRAQTARMRAVQEAAAQPLKSKSSSSSSSSSKKSNAPPPAKTTRKPRIPSKMTHAQCVEFMNNPTQHPVTKSRVFAGSKAYNKYVKECMEVLGDDQVPVIIATKVLTADNRRHYPKNRDFCIAMVNTASRHNNGMREGQRILLHPFDSSLIYDLNSQNAQRLLSNCKNEFAVLYLDIFTESFTIPVKLTGANERLGIENIEGVRRAIVDKILQWSNRQPSAAVFDAMIDGIQKIVDSRYLTTQNKREFEDMMMELTAMKHGIDIKSEDSQLSSSPNSRNRSVSKSVPRDMEPLPKGTRAQILKDLEAACIDMLDMITYTEFNDMKKKQLQLVVKVGPKTSEGKQRCYYVKNLYNYIKSVSKEGMRAKDPASNTDLSGHDIRNVILPKMRYIKPDARDPTVVEKRKYPAVNLIFKNVLTSDTHEPFFAIYLERKIGLQVATERLLGYIPEGIETDAANVSSAAVIGKIRDLFDAGRLFDNHMNPRAHINKSIAYWRGSDPVRKLAHMASELWNL